MTEQTKTCSKCKVEKLLSKFTNQKVGLYGVAKSCKSCCRSNHREKYREKLDVIDRERTIKKRIVFENRLARLKNEYDKTLKEFIEFLRKEEAQQHPA